MDFFVIHTKGLTDILIYNIMVYRGSALYKMVLFYKKVFCKICDTFCRSHRNSRFGAQVTTPEYVHYNINSILAPDRLEQLTAICKLLNIDVLIITESKLDENIPKTSSAFPGYHEPIRHDRPINGRHGGGVLMYIAENLVFQHKKRTTI